MFQAIPTTFAKHSVERGGNVMGLDRETTNGIMLLFNIAVKGDADTEARARQKLRATTDEFQEFAKKEGGLIDWQFLNYADFYQDPLGSYGADNVVKIRAAAKKYDPEGVFQTRAPGGFKIGKVPVPAKKRDEL
jgi:hypothetical protein